MGLGDSPIHNLFEAVEEIGLKVLRYSMIGVFFLD